MPTLSSRTLALPLLLAAVVFVTLDTGRAQTAGGKKYALLVGVNHYLHSGITSLQGAENDVEALARLLRKQAFQVRVLTTERGKKNAADAPTAANVGKELDTLLTKKLADDTVLIGLAGHGAEIDVPHPDDKEKEKKRYKSYSYFLPADASAENISYSTGHSDRLIELGRLFERLGLGVDKCGAGTKLVLIDACRDRREAASSTRRRSISPTHVNVPVGVNALFSCGPEEEALEMRFPAGADETVWHGVFFWHVIEGLSGKAPRNDDGTIDWANLTSYVQTKVPRFVQRRAKEMKKELPPQHPHAFLNAKRRVVLVAGLPVVNSIGMRLLRIPAGTFLMGSAAAERANVLKLMGQKDMPFWLKAEGPQHEVEITKDFHLGEKEVTQAEYEQVMGKNPSWFSATGEGKDKVKGIDTSRFPVETVSWQEAMKFCEKLTELDRKEGIIGREVKYRLPTEAEWEYACRGGARSYQVFHFGNSLSSAQANFEGSYPYGGGEKGKGLERTTNVASYEKNAFGLFDMHGNVWEWCYDWFDKDYYAKSPRGDPTGPSAGSERVLRGGSWFNFAWFCRSANRFGGTVANRHQHFGFRVALAPSGE